LDTEIRYEDYRRNLWPRHLGAASIAKFGEAPGVEPFMSILDAETMAITVYDNQQRI
jgi:hypothetical protein